EEKEKTGAANEEQAEAVKEEQTEDAKKEQSREAGQEKMPSPEELLAMLFAGMETKQVLGVMFGVLSEKAWENLGLKLPFGKKEEHMDLDSAKIAIDTLEFISGKLKDTVSPEEQKMADNLIAQLQINFVNKSQSK
ncbi:MAG: DUF1844 domain-containing protein, partial [Abditibacteriota bacterium]|nr:DUF1844 domain-containing protein [Abditibacteriota bacterium]